MSLIHFYSCVIIAYKRRKPKLFQHPILTYTQDVENSQALCCISHLSRLVSWPTTSSEGFPRGSVVASPTANQEMRLQSLGQEGPLGEAMAAHCSIRAWEIPGTEEPGGLQSTGSQRVRHDLATDFHFFQLPLKRVSSLQVWLTPTLAVLNPDWFLRKHVSFIL